MTPVVIRNGDAPSQILGSIGQIEFKIDRTEQDGPRSIEFLLLGLGACLHATVGHYLTRKNLPLDGLAVELVNGPVSNGNFYERILVRLKVSDQITEPQLATIRGVARACRIHKTLENGPEIQIDVSAGGG